MSKIPSFGEKKAKKLTRRLGFIIDESKGKGGHAKATHPTRRSKTRQGMITDCIIIPNRKEYSKPLREDWIKELKGFGFTKEEIIKNL